MKIKKQILLTCLISLALFISLYFLLSGLSNEKTYPVYLLNQDLNAGSKLEKTMFDIIMIPQSCNIPQACKKAEDIVGTYLVGDMKKGGLISVEDIAASQSGIIYPSIGQGKVLYTIALKAEDANGWWIGKGNDIILCVFDDSLQEKSVEDPINQETSNEPANPIQMLESIKIVRIMDETGREILADGKPPKMVCMEVTKEQAEIIYKAENGKKIKIIAQNPNEKQIIT